MPGAVERWLETFMCKQYADLFEAYGFKTLFSVCQLQPSTLHSMGIAREHCDKILENVSVLRQSIVASSPEHINSRDTSFPPPSYSLRHGMHSPHYTGSMGPNYSDQMYDQHLVPSNQTNSYSYHSSPNYPSMSPSHQQYPGHGHGIHYNNHDGYGGGQPHYITSGQEIYGKQPYGAGSRIHSGSWDGGGGQGGGSAGAGHEALYNHSARGVLASPPSPPPPPSPATMAVPQAHYRHVLIGEQGGGPHPHAWSQPHPSPMMPSPRATPSPGMTHGGPNRSPAHTKPYSPHPMPAAHQHVQQHHHHVQQQQGYGYQPPGPAMSPPKPPNMNGQMGGAHIVPSQSSNPVPPSAAAPPSGTDPLQSLQKMVLLEPQSRRPASRGGLAPSTPTPPVGGHVTDGGGVVGGISGGTYIVGPGILKPSPGSTPHESCSPASSVISLASPQPLPQPSTPCRPPQAVSSSGVVSTTADRSLSQSPASRSPCRSAADDEDEEDDEDEDEKPVLTDLDARPQHIASSVPDTTSRVASQQQLHLQPGSPQRGGGGGGNGGNKRHSPRKRRLLDALDADGCGPPQSTVSTTVVGRVGGPETGSENGVLNCVVVNGPPKWRPRKMALAASASRDVYDAPPAPSVECCSPRFAPPAPDTTTSVAAPSSSPSSMSLSPSPARVITYRKKWQTQAAADAARTAEGVDDGPVWQQHHHHQQQQQQPRRRHSSDDDQCTDGSIGVVNQEQGWSVPRVLPQGASPYEPYPGEYMPHGCYGDRADMHPSQPPHPLAAPLPPQQSPGSTISPTDGNTPKKKRGRPLGSKNKPKPFPPDGTGGEKTAAPKGRQGRKPKSLQSMSPVTPVSSQPLDGSRMSSVEFSVTPTVTVSAPLSTEAVGGMECAPPKRTDNRAKGPFVRIEGPWDHPVSVDVVNTTLGSSGQKDEETDARGGTSRGLRKAKRHSGEILVSAKRRMSKIGFSSTLSANYDVLTKDHTWVCALCRMGSHHRGLGDLFGPYFLAGTPETPPKQAAEVSLCPSTSAVKVAPQEDAVPGNDEGASSSADVANGQGAGAVTAAGNSSCRKIRAKRKRSELVEEFFKSTLSKKGKKAKEAVPEEPVEEAASAAPASCASNPAAKQESKASADQSQKEVWVHEDCLVWSHGVYLIGQKICGLAEAVHDAGGNACSLCKENGATLGCLNKGCVEQYHYVCANEKGCQLDEENYSLLCLKHKKKQKRATVGGGTT